MLYILKIVFFFIGLVYCFFKYIYLILIFFKFFFIFEILIDLVMFEKIMCCLKDKCDILFFISINGSLRCVYFEVNEGNMIC